MSLNWIKVEEYSFNGFLLMERFQLRFLIKTAEQEEKLAEQLGIALGANPVVRWYFLHKCPECRADRKVTGLSQEQRTDYRKGKVGTADDRDSLGARL